MELGAKGQKEFLRILRLAGIPEGEKDITITQKKETADIKKKVSIEWEA
jgi:hypothetical protein